MRRALTLFLALVAVVATFRGVAASTCDLNYILLSGGLQLTPYFNAATLTYTVNVPATTTSITVQAWQVDSMAYLDVSSGGGAYVQYMGGGNPTQPILLLGPTTIITIRVTCTDCQKVYTIVCKKPTTPPPGTGGFVIGDPQFTGLRGQNYQVHGVAGEVYNLISSSDLQVNSKFVFLSSGECPVVNGVKAKGCFSHPGSYLGEIGLMTKAGERVKLVAGPASQGFHSITVNNANLRVGGIVNLNGGGFVSRNSTHLVSIQAGNFAFLFANSDLFINQHVSVVNWNHLTGTHGLLGQTHTGKRYTGTVKDVEGEIEDYVITDRNLFGTKFLYNQFPL